MPYKVKKQGDKYVVYKKDTGKRVGATTGTKKALHNYLAALHANLKENTKSTHTPDKASYNNTQKQKKMKIREFKELIRKEVAKVLQEGYGAPVSESELRKLLTVRPDNINIDSWEVEVRIPGRELNPRGKVAGIDPGKYYVITWITSDNAVAASVYADNQYKKHLAELGWSGDVDTLETFASIINGSGNGKWSTAY